MKKLMKSRKGYANMVIVSIIITVFLLTATLIPYLNEAFDENFTELNTGDIESDAKEKATLEKTSALNIWEILLNILKLATWDIGDTLGLYWWIDIVFTLMLIILVLTVATIVWPGGS